MSETQMLSQANTMCALTDLFFGCILLLPIVLLWRQKTDRKQLKKWWIRFFLALDASCILGFVSHFCFPTGRINHWIWIVLYPLLLETVLLFDLTAFCRLCREQRPRKKDTALWHLFGLAVLLAAQTLSYFGRLDAVTVLSAFATLVAIVGFAGFIRVACRPGQTGERMMLLSFIPMLIGAYFEIRGNVLIRVIWYIDHDSIFHLCAALGVMLMSVGVRKSLRADEESAAA